MPRSSPQTARASRGQRKGPRPSAVFMVTTLGWTPAGWDPQLRGDTGGVGGRQTDGRGRAGQAGPAEAEHRSANFPTASRKRRTDLPVLVCFCSWFLAPRVSLVLLDFRCDPRRFSPSSVAPGSHQAGHWCGRSEASEARTRADCVGVGAGQRGSRAGEPPGCRVRVRDGWRRAGSRGRPDDGLDLSSGGHGPLPKAPSCPWGQDAATW